MEIFVDRDGEVILKKYSPISELGDFAKEYAEALYDSLNQIVLIADRDTFIAMAGASKKEFLNKAVGQIVESVMDGRKTDVTTTEGEYNIVSDHDEELKGYVATPIIANGDPIGAVIILSRDENLNGAMEQKLAETAAGFLARQMEQ